ncbi:zinc-binding dehydrogenase [Neorhizobium sp. NPDC001467]|uniref:zinc-binding dehydrogenase n=1 Tax=Neorhizobium sp. NPDC001467 TaxID=3390595 RepID=UPI003D02E3F9
MLLPYSGWHTHAISDGSDLRDIDPHAAPISTGLRVLGMTRFSAYAGLRNIGRPKPGECYRRRSQRRGWLSRWLAGQDRRRARHWNSRGAQKCAFVKNELGFNAAINHRDSDSAQQPAEAFPYGIDVYFANVGGAVWNAVIPLLNNCARVPLCGMISHYNDEALGPPSVDRLPSSMKVIQQKSITVRGFMNVEFIEQQPTFLRKPLVGSLTQVEVSRGHCGRSRQRSHSIHRSS